MVMYKGKGCTITIVVSSTFFSFSLATRDAKLSPVFGLVWPRQTRSNFVFKSNHASRSFFLSALRSPRSFFSSSSYQPSRSQWLPQKFKRFVLPLMSGSTRLPNKLNTNFSSVVSNSMSSSLVRPAASFSFLKLAAICVREIFSFNGVLVIRSDRFGKVDPHQHYICFTPHRLEGQA